MFKGLKQFILFLQVEIAVPCKDSHDWLSLLVL